MAEFKHRYPPALGDAFALATVEYLDEMLFIDADDDYGGISTVRTERFRTEPVG